MDSQHLPSRVNRGLFSEGSSLDDFIVSQESLNSEHEVDDHCSIDSQTFKNIQKSLTLKPLETSMKELRGKLIKLLQAPDDYNERKAVYLTEEDEWHDCEEGFEESPDITLRIHETLSQEESSTLSPPLVPDVPRAQEDTRTELIKYLSLNKTRSSRGNPPDSRTSERNRSVENASPGSESSVTGNMSDGNKLAKTSEIFLREDPMCSSSIGTDQAPFQLHRRASKALNEDLTVELFVNPTEESPNLFKKPYVFAAQTDDEESFLDFDPRTSSTLIDYATAELDDGPGVHSKPNESSANVTLKPSNKNISGTHKESTVISASSAKDRHMDSPNIRRLIQLGVLPGPPNRSLSERADTKAGTPRRQRNSSHDQSGNNLDSATPLKRQKCKSGAKLADSLKGPVGMACSRERASTNPRRTQQQFESAHNERSSNSGSSSPVDIPASPNIQRLIQLGVWNVPNSENGSSTNTTKSSSFASLNTPTRKFPFTKKRREPVKRLPNGMPDTPNIRRLIKLGALTYNGNQAPESPENSDYQTPRRLRSTAKKTKSEKSARKSRSCRPSPKQRRKDRAMDVYGTPSRCRENEDGPTRRLEDLVQIRVLSNDFLKDLIGRRRLL